MLVILFAVLMIFMLTTKVSDIQTDVAELRINENDNNDSEVQEIVIDINDSEFVKTINKIVTDKIYYRQPYINSSSRNEIDYEITLYELNENGGLMTQYRILLNDNEKENETTNVSNLSRIDVMHFKSTMPFLSKNYSLKLTKAQEIKLVEAVMEYRP